ncbi:MAG TPA: agmatinase [Bryobacteraceae bacterium]|nr:agmatinase [Bryobacteraceae bacterium]
MSDTTPANVYGGLDIQSTGFETSKALIWPVPFEKTVSYGRGTSEGPAAIIEASRYMELYDEELDAEPASIGIHTLPPIATDLEPEAMMAALEHEAGRLLHTKKFLCALGGEHSITPPLVRATHRQFPNLSVLQIDAHADLRESYEGTPLSHASAMRRVLEVCPAVQVGIRSLSIEEARASPTLPTKVFYAKDICGKTDWYERAVESLTQDVYLTIDVDGLDPSIVPSTGTPEPGGLSWYEVLTLLRTVCARRNVVGMDLVELCGCGTSNAPAFLASKLVYKTLGYVFRHQLEAAPKSAF